MNKPTPSSKQQDTGAGEAASQTKAMILEKLGLMIAAKRDEAIKGRLASGIEKIWTEDEEFYQGYDDANRHEFVAATSKPTEGGRTVEVRRAAIGSTLFPNITGPYTDAAAAKVADMLLPTDDRNFVIEPTPVPDILDEGEGWPELEPEAAAPVVPPKPAGAAAVPPGATPVPQGLAAMAMPQGNPAQQIMANPAAKSEDQQLAEIFAKLKATREKAQTASKLMQDDIDDDLTECGYHTELRMVIDDAARLGSGALKGPVPVKREVRVWAKNPRTGERELVIKKETKPGSRRVNLWNLFPDFPACGQNIHDGGFIFERDHFSEKKLRKLKDGKGPAQYIDAQIDAAIEEGPDKRDLAASRGFQQNQDIGNSKVWEVWYYYGSISGEEMVAAGCSCEDETLQYDVLVTMVNDRVIKVAKNPLDSGEFPYDLLAWKARPDMPWGVGVPRQGRTAQRIVTASTRALMDNAGASSRPHKVMTDAIEQDGDPWTWVAGSETVDVSKAMQFFVQPSLQVELTAIIQLGERMMELHTGLPMIILGMQGNVQETAHGRALQNNNGSTVLRRIARNFDGQITEPHIKRYHAWKMKFSERDEIKGDFQIKARGSAALVERDLQNQQIPTVLNLSLNPSFEMDPALSAEEYLKSQRFDPKAFKLSDKKKQENAAKQPPPPPQIAAAQIREQGATERLKMELGHEANQNDLDRQLEKMGIEIEGQLGAATLSMEERAALNDAKVTLAGLTMKLRTQRELSAVKGPQVATPPTEPAGRAQPGAAYQQ
jgi:hypothetical protein